MREVGQARRSHVSWAGGGTGAGWRVSGNSFEGMAFGRSGASRGREMSGLSRGGGGTKIGQAEIPGPGTGLGAVPRKRRVGAWLAARCHGPAQRREARG
jgi:hypothetical protein